MTWRRSAGNKYGNKRVEMDGHNFASKKEAGRYQLLRWRCDEGEIRDLKLQPRYPMIVNGEKICVYVGDFEYVENGEIVTEDAKGVKTDVFVLKAKLFRALYGRDVVLT